MEHMGHLLKREERTDPDIRVDHFIPDTWQVCFYHIYASKIQFSTIVSLNHKLLGNFLATFAIWRSTFDFVGNLIKF